MKKQINKIILIIFFSSLTISAGSVIYYQYDQNNQLKTMNYQLDSEKQELETEKSNLETENSNLQSSNTELEASNNELNDKVNYLENNPVIKYVEREKESAGNISSIRLNVSNILQNPEMPTGCEITSLTIDLNYLFPNDGITKQYMADNYLDKATIGTASPNDAFLGSPYSSHSYGCYAPVIERAANSYISAAGKDYQAHNITGTEFTDLLKYLSDGYPVIIWGTINMGNTYQSTSWNINGNNVPWLANEHCLVLIGYDSSNYYIADPLKDGITAYDRSLVETRYGQMGKQAVVIYKTSEQ